MEDIKLWIWYVLAMGNHKALARKLYHKVGSVKKIYEYTRSDYIEAGLDNEKKIAELNNKSLDEVQRTIWFAEKYGVEFIPIDSENYPPLLKNIYDPPLLLYKRGMHFSPANELYIALIGTSNISDYGRDMAYALSKDLVDAGITIVGGMSPGIETVAHKSCVDAGGFTVAALTTGVNSSPGKNSELMRKIMNSGAVISEYGFDEPSYPSRYAERNRIISGLCVGTVVVEAGEKSRSLMTANYALDQGRDVFAVPGNVGKASSGGVNELIKETAKIVTNVTDILEEYTAIYPHLIRTQGFSSHDVEFEIPKACQESDNVQSAIIACLKEGPKRLDAIIAQTKIPIGKLNGVITLLEISGQVLQDKFGNYKLIK